MRKITNHAELVAALKPVEEAVVAMTQAIATVNKLAADIYEVDFLAGPRIVTGLSAATQKDPTIWVNEWLRLVSGVRRDAEDAIDS